MSLSYEGKTPLLICITGDKNNPVHFCNVPRTKVDTSGVTHFFRVHFDNGAHIDVLDDFFVPQMLLQWDDIDTSFNDVKPDVDMSLLSRCYGYGPGFFIPIVVSNILNGMSEVIIDATSGSDEDLPVLIDMINDLFILGIEASIVRWNDKHAIQVHNPVDFNELCSISFPSLDYSFISNSTKVDQNPWLEVVNVESLEIQEGQEFFTIDDVSDKFVLFCAAPLEVPND